MKILVSFSGGKDSQACLIQAFKQYGGGNLTAVFCDTGGVNGVLFLKKKEKSHLIWILRK